jgi:hypothetical protein
MQSVFSTPTRVSLTRMRVIMAESDNDTLECDFYTLRVIPTRIENLTRMNVITTRTREIYRGARHQKKKSTYNRICDYVPK